MCDPSDMNTDEKIKKCNRKEAEKERQKKKEICWRAVSTSQAIE